MSWKEGQGQGFTFTCDTNRCAKALATTLYPPYGDLYQAFVDARNAGWFAVLNEQHCPTHQGAGQ